MDTREPEVWKPIPDYEGIYEISSWGRVKGLDRFKKSSKYTFHIYKGRILKPDNRNNYLQVLLCKNYIKKWFKIHIIVCAVFCSNKHLLGVVNHIDTDTLNNYYKNLEKISQRENTAHYHKSRTDKASKYIGVTFEKKRNKWKSSIYYQGKAKNLGRYYTQEEAHQAYLNALKEYGLTNKYADKVT